MAVQQIYGTGTATVAANSDVVTGSGTAWSIALVNGGTFSTKGRSIPIIAVVDDTHLKLAYSAPADMAGNGLQYAIELGRSDAADAIQATRKLADLADTLSNKVSPFIRQMLDDADAATVRATLGLNSTAFTVFGGNETNGYDTVAVARFAADFVATGRSVLVMSSLSHNRMPGAGDSYAYHSLWLTDLSSGTVVHQSPEDITALHDDTLGDYKSSVRSIGFTNLVVGRSYRVSLYVRANIVNRGRPQGMLISGICF